jgi:hypothetical protein
MVSSKLTGTSGGPLPVPAQLSSPTKYTTESALECLVLQASNVRCWPLSVFFPPSLIEPSFLLGTPSYVSRIKPEKYPLVLRNLHLPAIILNTVMMLLVLALIPLDDILGGANVLSVLAQAVGIVHLKIHFANF